MKSVILPELKKLNVPTGTTAYLTISGADTTAAHAQLASFIERWKSENVNAVYIAGEDVVVPQFVEQGRGGSARRAVDDRRRRRACARARTRRRPT